MNNQSSLYVPKFDTDVIITFENDFAELKVDYIPNSCYNEKELHDEVKLIIEKMINSVLDESVK